MTNEWLATKVKGYKFYKNNFYFDLAKHTKADILVTTKMTEEEFEKLVKDNQ